jgi:hypothetical protein
MASVFAFLSCLENDSAFSRNMKPFVLSLDLFGRFKLVAPKMRYFSPGFCSSLQSLARWLSADMPTLERVIWFNGTVDLSLVGPVCVVTNFSDDDGAYWFGSRVLSDIGSWIVVSKEI